MKLNNNSFAASCQGYGDVFSGIADMHSHVLPEMDDGAADVKESLAMLACMREQGILSVVASSHFYAERETPEAFLERRDQAVRKLLSGGYHPDIEHPRLYIGAEVAFFSGMAHSPQLEKLCILGTRNILVEMPFEKWGETVINEVLSIKEALGLRPIIAHIERYIGYQRSSTLGRLIDGGALIQSNAEFFIEKKTAKKALKLLAKGGIHLLGSDAHNMDSRAPKLGEAAALIRESKFGDAILEDIAECSNFVLKKAAPVQEPVTA